MSDERRKEYLHTPVEQLDLSRIENIEELVRSFGSMSFQSRNLGTCARILERIVTDPDRPTVFLGMAGALVAGGLRKVVRDMIQAGLVDVIVTTGAIVYQDFYQSRGYRHYIGTPLADDATLRELEIDRIYDTYVDEAKFQETDRYIAQLVEELEPRAYATREFFAHLGAAVDDESSILAAAARHEIPIYCPAIADSSIGIGLAIYYHNQLVAKKTDPPLFQLDTIRDNYEMAQLVGRSPKTAAIYIGGGVPKNYINDAVVTANMLDYDADGHEYAIQLTMDRAEWGGLSGSTLAEAQSWGKIHLEAKKAMAYVEMTVALPLLAASLFHSGTLDNRPRLRFQWEGATLRAIEATK